MLKQLMDRNLVRITGHDESLGRPYLYGTTRAFLESFGLRDLKDLPMSDRLRRKEPPSADADDVTDEPDSDATTEADDDEEDVAAA